LHASPLARRLAREAGLDLEVIEGTGRDGVIQAKDVRARLAGVPAAATPVEAAPAAKPAVGTNQHPKMRQTIAALMERANREIPQYYLSTTIDMHAAMEWLHEKNRSLPVDQRLVPAALVMHAVARAAVKVPQLNGEWRDGGFVPSDKVNLGLVTSLRGGGVLVPVIENASELSVAETMSELKSAVQRARTGRLRASELTGASITVTSLGEQGVEAVYGVVFPPQVAIVGVGAVVERPWARDGLLGVRPVVTVTLAADHRASDGAVGARLLNLVDELLQHPEA
jgi:pyruvate dehydrogenase E2 component (dihydrolipoamide acetyltransferase)